MEQDEDLGGIFLVSVEELGLTGLWSSVKDVRGAGGQAVGPSCSWGTHACVPLPIVNLRLRSCSPAVVMHQAACTRQHGAVGRCTSGGGRCVRHVHPCARTLVWPYLHTSAYPHVCLRMPTRPLLQVIESRVPLQNVSLYNKVGRAVHVDHLALQ